MLYLFYNILNFDGSQTNASYLVYSLLRRYSISKIYFTLTLPHFIGRRCCYMIDYSPFWATVERTGNNWYTLANKLHVPNSTLHRLKHNKDVSTKTLNDLCRILNCNISDIVQYIPSDEDQIL